MTDARHVSDLAAHSDPTGSGPPEPTPAAGLTGTIAGASFAFQCDAPELAEYARHHLAPLTDAGSGAAPPTVSAVLRWHDGQPPRERAAPELAGMQRVDRDLYTDHERLYWFRVDDLRDLYLQVTWKDGRLRVLGDFYYRLGNSRASDALNRARHWRHRRMLRARRFTTLLSYLVYYPCWWWLEQQRDVHPIHAAGVLTDAGVILVAGASGVGKSTLAVALATAVGGRLLSDSFVLHNGVDVLAVREPVLLDSWSRRWLGKQADELQAIEWRYGLNRGGYHLPAHRWATEGRAALLVFPRRSPQGYVRRISAEHAHQRLSAADLIINDLRRYWAFAAVMEHLVSGGLVLRRETQLARLTAAVPCYELGLTADQTCTATVDSILQLAANTPLRAAGSR